MTAKGRQRPRWRPQFDVEYNRQGSASSGHPASCRLVLGLGLGLEFHEERYYIDDIKPKFQCSNCHRGVLNRSAECCLFCGAKLSAGVRLSEVEIGAREKADAEERERQRRQCGPPRPQTASRSDHVDGIGDTIDFLGGLFD
jgi:hypothetical protein